MFLILTFSNLNYGYTLMERLCYVNSFFLKKFKKGERKTTTSPPSVAYNNKVLSAKIAHCNVIINPFDYFFIGESF